MTGQQLAFAVGTGPTARYSDPETAKDAGAAKATDPVKLSAHFCRALIAHARHPNGLTDFELALLTGLAQTSIGRRRLDLQRAGLVEATGDHRPSPSAAPARVYRITDDGMALARAELARRGGELP